MSTLIRFLPTIIGLVLGTLLFTQGERLTQRTKELARANDTINILQDVNTQQATAFQELLMQAKGLRLLLANQSDALTELDKQNRKTADELQEALATPPAGRPDCAREPLPGGALRLLQPAHHGGANQGSEAAAAAGAGAPLPGA
ncbi:hypothetical protein [Aeromonas hydrophila]|uniref:hypothetical protein n=1 Tax=Aeromonas hydrophila TaxID=644 RepID=UPI0004D6EE82|nr:hypothetical protein [Aeromonas hydrophila]EJN6956462.1 hypothetical protein [Aeromonas hydrophila]KER62817.1 hypothetical protein HR52_07375 [Aeromonas hydrophila]OCY05878.1 hypothetical protein A9X69_14390 [Aeromonas hydrophila]OCY11287.1 hypothetical protein A9X70_00465 [Aeromonas hydrophila]TNI68325.1 hypothetical protein CF124_02240 [Aeromonas hydrophila]